MTVVTNPARTSSDDEIESGRESVVGGDGSGLELDENARLYDDEKQSDIVFVAGINGDTYRFPGHRRVLAATSPVFAALLAVKTDVIVVDYVDRRGFEQLLRYHYCEPTQLNSVATARCALDTAYKFLCPPLAERCARRLDEMLDAGVALEILRDLRYLCARLPGAASAPPLPALSDDAAARTLAQCSRWCDSLAHNALLVLDENADAALTDERLEELTYEDLALIVKRDTLRVSNELVLAEALSRWATAVCKRTKRELTPSNKRAALGELAYCPRYLLLAGDELERALALELLEPVERALVAARARQAAPGQAGAGQEARQAARGPAGAEQEARQAARGPAGAEQEARQAARGPAGAEQEALLRLWARPRPAEPAALPVHLSARSEPPPEEPQPSKLCGRRPKRPKQPSFNPEEKNKKKGCCACFGEGLLRAFICLFD